LKNCLPFGTAWVFTWNGTGGSFPRPVLITRHWKLSREFEHGTFVIVIVWGVVGLSFANRNRLSDPDTIRKVIIAGILGGPAMFAIALVGYITDHADNIHDKIKNLYEDNQP
jgi:hypothetical protein